MAIANITNNILTDSGVATSSLQPTITLTTTGTSGAATLVGATLNIPQYQAAGTYVTSVTASAPLSSSGSTNPNITITQVSSTVDGYLSFSDYNVFSGKISGSGTAGYITRYTGSGSTIGNSGLYDDGTTVSLISRALSGTSASFSGSVTANATSTFSNGSSLSAIFSNGGGVSNFNSIELRGGTAGTAVNWQISKDNTASNAFQITPSTTSGGTTYTTPGFTLASTGAATFSSTIKSSDTNGFAIGSIASFRRIQYGSDAATAFSLLTDTNSYAGLYAGAATFSAKVSAKGGSNFGGYYMDYQSDATSRSFRVSSEHLVFADFVIQRSTTRTGTTYEDLLYFDANRAATFSSSVQVGNSSGGTMLTVGTIGASGVSTPTAIQMDNSYLSGSPAFDKLKFYLFKSSTEAYGFNVADNSDLQYWAGTTSSGMHRWFTSQTERMRITSGGNVGIGTSTVTTFSANYIALNINAPAGYGSGTIFKINNVAETNFYAESGITTLNIAGVYAITGSFGTAFRVASGGNVLIGTTTDEGYKLYVNGGSSNGFLFYSTSAANQIKAAGTAPAITFSNTITSPTIGGSLGACTSAGQFLSGTAAGDMILINQFTGNKLYITNYSGGVYLTQGATSWTANSDIRLKNINSHIENAVEKLSTLQTINFSYKDDKFKKQNLGLIAQEVEKIFPELIDKNGDGMLGVRYTELVPVLIKAVQELKAEIETLKNK